VTPWVFLGQVLSPDHSCRAAVARLNAHRVARGRRPCSARTGAYCQARQRLPERLVADVARRTGRALDAGADSRWLWKGRRVYIYDGSHASMPDAPENQAEYPQPDTQKPGLGFPLARLAAVFSLATGAVLDLAIGRYAGKGQSELVGCHTRSGDGERRLRLPSRRHPDVGDTPASLRERQPRATAHDRQLGRSPPVPVEVPE
jgi:hypothetical protein